MRLTNTEQKMAYFEAAEATIKTLDITVGALSNRVISIEGRGSADARESGV